MVSCVFPGSFDPVTKGHIDLIARASAIFDHVTVTLMINIRKEGSISPEKRVELLQKACRHLPNVSIDRWDGLLADYMREKNEHIIVRGIRSMTEAENEMIVAAANKMLNDQTETVFIPSDPALSGISSSAVREIVSFGGNISTFVPEEIREEIECLLSKKNK